MYVLGPPNITLSVVMMDQWFLLDLLLVISTTTFQYLSFFSYVLPPSDENIFHWMLYYYGWAHIFRRVKTRKGRILRNLWYLPFLNQHKNWFRLIPIIVYHRVRKGKIILEKAGQKNGSMRLVLLVCGWKDICFFWGGQRLFFCCVRNHSERRWKNSTDWKLLLLLLLLFWGYLSVSSFPTFLD